MARKEVNSIQSLIENFLIDNKDKTLFFHKKGYITKSINCKDLNEKINKTRIFLKKEKIKKSDKIIILGNNSIEWIIIYFACVLSGIIVVPLDVLTNKKLLKKIQEQVKAKAIFQDKDLASINIKKYYLDNLDNYLEDTKFSRIQKVKIDSNDILEIIYTSGTTSVPKGVILTDKNMTSALNSAIKLIKLKTKLRFLNLLPLSHIFGKIYGLFLLMHFGHKIFFLDSILPRKVIPFIRNKNIHSVVLVPAILAALKKELEGKSTLFNLGIQFRLIGIGGASLDKNLEKWWKRHLILVIQGYGLTETSSVVSSNDLLHFKTGSVGKISEDVKFKLGKDNEILVKGNNVTKGYYNDKEKTIEAFEDGWFKTGDIGIIKNGYLYLKERKKDVIITEAGLNVYPKDIENILNRLNNVKESCVFEKDKNIHAVLILKKKSDVSDIINNANNKLLSHQKITSYSVWPYKNFPKTQTGKMKKYLVKQEISKLKSNSNAYSYKNKLYNIINEVLKSQQKIKLDSKLSDLGMDSLKRVELISELEKEFDIEIMESKLNQDTKVADLDEFMREPHIKKVRFKKWPINPVFSFIRSLLQRIFFFPLMRVYTKTDYYGLDNIKNIKKPVIFVSNHQSWIDVPVIIKKFRLKTSVASAPDSVFGIMSKGPLYLKIFQKFLGYFSGLFFNSYPFGEGIGTNLSLEFTGEMIDNGYSILIFPERYITTDGKIKTFKSGIGYLALNMDIPIVPIKINGLYEILHNRKIIPNKFGRSVVKIGKPMILKDLSYMEATKLIERSVREL